MTRPRLGFIGLGWIGRHRLEAVAATGLADIAVLHDPSAEAVEAARHLAPDAALAGSVETLLDLRPDGVVIASPSALHAEQSFAALSEGMAVFCQKPLGRSAAEVRAVVEKARETNRLLAVDLCYRRTAAFGAMKAALDVGRIGRPFSADFAFHNAYGPDKAWFYDIARSGGGAVMDLGTHLVDLALWMFDAPVAGVSATLYRHGERLCEPGLEDYGIATIAFEGGETARIACSWNLHAGRDAVIVGDIHGTDGGLSVRNRDGSFYDFEARLLQGTAAEPLAEPPDDWGGRTIAGWVESLASGAGFDPAAPDYVALSDTLDRIYADAFGGQRAAVSRLSAARSRGRGGARGDAPTGTTAGTA